MSFSAQWLALREPYDQAARNETVLDAVRKAFAGHPAVRVADLGCGTGSTMRAVAPVLPARQDWRLLDNDAALLEAAHDTAPAMCEVTTIQVDLAADLGWALGEDTDLVTMSALLDLVSVEWLDRLVAILAISARPLYAALSYDGRVSLSPASRYDEAIVAAVNLHQLRDKGAPRSDPARRLPRPIACAPKVSQSTRAVPTGTSGHRTAPSSSRCWRAGPAPPPSWA